MSRPSHSDPFDESVNRIGEFLSTPAPSPAVPEEGKMSTWLKLRLKDVSKAPMTDEERAELQRLNAIHGDSPAQARVREQLSALTALLCRGGKTFGPGEVAQAKALAASIQDYVQLLG